MNHLNATISVIIIVGILSCSKLNNNIKCVDIKINNKSIAEHIDISPIVDSVEIIKINEPKDDHIEDISQLYLVNNYLLFFDIYTKKVQLYTDKGNFIKTISKNGISKDQGLNIIDCFVDNNKRIYVYDFAQMKVTIYDSSFKLTESIQGKRLLHYNHIAPIPNSSNYIGYSSYNIYNQSTNICNINILNKKLEISANYLPYKKKYQGILLLTYNSPFFLYKDSLRFMRSYDPYIYNIDDNFRRIYKIIYLTENLPEDILENVVNNHLDDFKDQSISQNIRNSYFINYTYPREPILENKKYMFIVSAQNRGEKERLFFSLIRKHDMREMFSGYRIIDSDRYRIDIPFFNWYNAQTDQFITYCTGHQLIALYHNDSPLSKNISIDESAFYLIIVRLK